MKFIVSGAGQIAVSKSVDLVGSAVCTIYLVKIDKSCIIVFAYLICKTLDSSG